MTTHWQNLIHKKCPKCDERLEYYKKNDAYICKTDGCPGFYVTSRGLIKIFLDPEHATVKYASREEREIINIALKELQLDSLTV